MYSIWNVTRWTRRGTKGKVYSDDLEHLFLAVSFKLKTNVVGICYSKISLRLLVTWHRETNILHILRKGAYYTDHCHDKVKHSSGLKYHNYYNLYSGNYLVPLNLSTDANMQIIIFFILFKLPMYSGILLIGIKWNTVLPIMLPLPWSCC